MKNLCLFIILPFLLIAINSFSQTSIENRRPSNNPTVNGPIIDAREVGDPTLAGGKNGTVDKKQADKQAILQQLSSSAGFSFSGYQIEVIDPVVTVTNASLSQIGKLKIIDVRADPFKVGFKPIDYWQRKKGITAIGLQVKQGLNKWLLEDVFAKYTDTDSLSDRQLVLVINKCWLSNEANYPYHATQPQLMHVLHYDLALYSSLGNGYYPQIKMIGQFTKRYDPNEKGTTLFDSLAQLICKEISNTDFTRKEKNDRIVLAADFNSYYNEQKNRLNNIAVLKKGVYKTYEDFLNQRVDSDSIEIITKYDNAGRSPIYAYQLMQFTDKNPASTSNSWGYADGNNLYINIGNGFFVRLVRSNGNYIFYWLNNIREDRIKASVSNGIKLGNSSFDIIKDYSRVTPLTYQLDALTGKLY